MCGISGFFNFHSDGAEQRLQWLNDAQTHRGPDDSDIWLSRPHGIGLAHRRLAIVDLSPLGRQPMTSATGRYVIVYNGEVYNFRELREELVGRGHRFKGGSDTEVMLAGFEEWGIESTIKCLNGMFAAAVFDMKTELFYLFRDRLGVKPLYYQWVAGALWFSSELTAPFAALSSREIDRDALALYFRHYYIPAPRTIYKSIKKLEPGLIAIVSRAAAEQERFDIETVYWSAQEQINRQLAMLDRGMEMEEALDLLDAGLTRSVGQRMISDVPLGAFLSGGIDSSLITAYMQKNSSQPVKTFTIGFADQTFNEAEAARQIASHLGTDHTEFYLTDQEALNVIPNLARIYGEPFADSSQIPTYLVSKLTRGKVTVALSGDGGDELFAGYRTYRSLAKVNRYESIFPKGMAVFVGRNLSNQRLQRGASAIVGEDALRRIVKGLRLFAGEREKELNFWPCDHIISPEKLVLGASPAASFLPLKRCAGNYTEQIMCDNISMYLPDDILVKVDRASMANSLEVRAPFTDDKDLFDLAWRIPFRLKDQGGEGKVVLKKLLARHLPRELFERPKQGFSVPLRHWLHGPLREWVGDSILPDRIRREGFLNPLAVQIVHERSRQNDEFAALLWAICIFQSWREHFAAPPESELYKSASC